ncbi:ABC transporter substrate-binding protein [Neorhizobium sp. Rsf11]|uniref:ABC transporter substrate-binding protein n=2 Tax=Neorhizobium TaxID=1525371 RepID=A0ABV0M350_9HYPH|nr:ABC transporter substrate-binding protein [Neorhizobium petrolearium]MCC2609474.1 ABC transporter substrate-binding protein [Neorhizobium petrolearium]WGI69683.1 ABC transporter substrate-binding protein [Neorhizobium petrolearium]
MSKALSITATVLLAGLSFAALSAAQAATVTIGTDVDAGTLDPRLARDTTAYRTADLIYSGLVHLTPGLEAKPDLAESWQTPDPTTWIFKLRPNLKFSDGSPLTADDVVFTFTTILAKDFNAPMRALYTPISVVEAVDSQTVKFTLSAPYAPLLSYLDIGIVPKALVEGGTDIALKPVGAGPMKLTSWTRGSDIKLEANPNYWGERPKADKVSIKIIGDGSARAQAFEAGDLDIIQSPLAPQDVKRLEADSRFGHVIQAGLGVTYINFNTKDPLLSSLKMRRAFSMLIDQSTIVNDIYQGVDEVASSVVLPSSWAYSADVKQPGFGIEGAKALFKEEGWSDTNGDGILDKGGKPLAVTLATHSEDSNRVQTIEFLQANFQAAGIDAKTQISDWPSFSTNYVQKSQHQIALLGWLNIVDPDRLLFAQLTTGGSTNWGSYSNPAVDDLLKQGRSATTQADRAAAYQKAAKVLADELPYYIVSYQGYQLFYSKRLPFEVQATSRGNMRGLIGLKD